MRTWQRIARLIRPAIGLPALAALALAGAVVLALGCNPEQQRLDEAGPAAGSHVADVPVPAGFRFNAKESYDRSTGGFRLVSHLYEGGAKVRDVTEFYRRAMPAAGWETVQESFEYGKQRMVFRKGEETAYVSVWDDWGTKVLIQIFPTGRTPA